MSQWNLSTHHCDVCHSIPAVETKGERTRRRLLELAVRRFAEDGFRRTSVSAIAREAGVSQAAVYAYFASKEALFEAAVDLDAAELIAEADEVVDEAVPLVESLPVFLLRLREGLPRHRLARRVLAGLEPEVIDRVVDLPALKEIVAEMEGRLRREQAQGLVRDDIDAGLLAVGIETLVLSLLLGMVQVGGGHVDQRTGGVVAVFQALLTRPRA